MSAVVFCQYIWIDCYEIIIDPGIALDECELNALYEWCVKNSHNRTVTMRFPLQSDIRLHLEGLDDATDETHKELVDQLISEVTCIAAKGEQPLTFHKNVVEFA